MFRKLCIDLIRKHFTPRQTQEIQSYVESEWDGETSATRKLGPAWAEQMWREKFNTPEDALADAQMYWTMASAK